MAFSGIVLALMALRGRYRATIGQRFLDDARTILSVTAVSAMIITFIRLLVSDHPEIAEEEIRSWLFAAVYLIIGRGILAMVIERINTTRQGGAPTLILGAGRVGHLIARRLLAHPELGLRPVGFVDPDPLEVERPSGLPLLGSGDDLERVVREHDVEHAIVAFSTASHDMQLGVSRALQQMKVSISIVPRLFEGVPDKIELERMGGLPLVSIYPSDPSDWRVGVKYASDRVLALLGTIIVSPLLLSALSARCSPWDGRSCSGSAGSGWTATNSRCSSSARWRGIPRPVGRRTLPGPQSQAAGADLTRRGAEASRGEGRTGTPPASERSCGARARMSCRSSSTSCAETCRSSAPGPSSPPMWRCSRIESAATTIATASRPGITGWAQVHGLRGDTASTTGSSGTTTTSRTGRPGWT